MLYYKGFVDAAYFFLKRHAVLCKLLLFSCFSHMGYTEQQKLNYENLIERTNALKYIPTLVP